MAAVLDRLIASIRPADGAARAAAERRQAELTKPAGSLGRLEDIAHRVCAAQGTVTPTVARRAVVVFAADHGVTEEGVSAYPRAVTAQMVANFQAGGAAVCALAKAAGAALHVVDVGVGEAGTANFAREPAMTRARAEAAILGGASVVQALEADLVGVGEMGIGNSTSAAAIAAVMCGLAPRLVVGRGTGVDDAGLARKVAVVERALALHRPSPDDPVGVLAAVGGLEIAAIAGACLGAAASRRVVLVDGFISTAGACLAAALAPACADYLLAAHRSVEPGHGALLERIGIIPILDLGMRLGEGSGAAVAMPVVVAAVAAFREMATFASARVSGKA